jgi:hypothetical protein
MKKVFVIAIALTLALSAVALAGANADFKLATHVRLHNAKTGCAVTITGCGDIVTTNNDGSVDAFAVGFDLTEYKGVAYGLCWDATISSGTFTSCSDLVITSFDIAGYMPSGGGAAHTWYDCQYSNVAVAGFVWVYVYGPGMICPCDHPDPDILGGIQALDCNENLDYPPRCVFCAGVGGYVGDDPCDPTATAPSTWSEIKGLFE